MDEIPPVNSFPLVSIVMNCYNGEKYLREAIDSVFAQTWPNWEIIFWDNASTDGTQEIVGSYDARLKYFRAETNTPLGPARNMAMKMASGEFIAFLDVDDVFLPDTLQKRVGMMQSGDYGLVYGGAVIIDEAGRAVGRNRPKYAGGKIFECLLRRYDITMASAMIRRSVIESEQLAFNENLSYSPDYNLFMKIAARHPVGVIPQLIVKYRRSSGSLSRKTLHLVSREAGQTLRELRERYPETVSSCSSAYAEAYAKLHFYDAVSHVNQGKYSAARKALKPVIGRRVEYLILYLMLFLPFPKENVLRWLGR